MKLPLFSSMLNLMFPPQASTHDEELVAALDRNTAATKDVIERAAKIDRALDNIRAAGEGLFA